MGLWNKWIEFNNKANKYLLILSIILFFIDFSFIFIDPTPAGKEYFLLLACFQALWILVAVLAKSKK